MMLSRKPGWNPVKLLAYSLTHTQIEPEPPLPQRAGIPWDVSRIERLGAGALFLR